MANLYEINKWAGEVCDDYTKSGADLTEGVVKVAKLHDLTAHDIELLVGRVNRSTIVPMHQKIAASELPRDAVFDTVSADAVIKRASSEALRPGMATPSLPPKRASVSNSGKSRFEAMMAQYEPKPAGRRLEDFLENPALLEVESDTRKIAEVRDFYSDSARQRRDAATRLTMESQTLDAEVKDEMETHLRAGTPPAVVRQAMKMANSDYHLLKSYEIQQRLGIPEVKMAEGERYEIAEDHPLIKTAAKHHELMVRASSELTIGKQFAQLAKAADMRLMLLEVA